MILAGEVTLVARVRSIAGVVVEEGLGVDVDSGQPLRLVEAQRKVGLSSRGGIACGVDQVVFDLLRKLQARALKHLHL